MSENAPARINLGIQADLKDRMDAVGDEISWSAVAAEAFKAKLMELESQKKGETLEDIIARMRAVDELDRNAAYQAGRRAGEWWVRAEARPAQLRELEASLTTEERGDERGALEAIGFPWKVESDDTNASLVEQTDYVRGCAEGALAIWEQIKQKLEKGGIMSRVEIIKRLTEIGFVEETKGLRSRDGTPAQGFRHPSVKKRSSLYVSTNRVVATGAYAELLSEVKCTGYGRLGYPFWEGDGLDKMLKFLESKFSKKV